MGIRSYTSSVNTKQTPQSQKILGSQQVLNNAGGYVFQVDDWKRLTRFLVLGTESGTYYVSEKTLTVDNAQVVLRCLKQDGLRTVTEIVNVSHAGRAPKNDAAIFALAMATVFGDKYTRVAAFAAVPKVCRIGTHLYSFAEARQALGGGWGRSMKGAISRWYTAMNDEKLAYQLVKYRQRNGWSARDLLRLSHPKPLTPVQNDIFNWVVKQEFKTDALYPKTLEGFRTLLTCTTAKQAIPIIEKYDLPREAVESVNTEFLKSPEVWEVLLATMPLEATIRNLGVMSNRGLIRDLSAATKTVVSRLENAEYLRKSRIHPFKVLVAMKQYQSGMSRGGVTWTPVQSIVDALDTAFYESFQNVEPTGQRFAIGVDVSGSMGSPTNLSNNLSCAEAAAAMAMIIARTEKNYAVMGFAHGLVDLNISPRQRLDDIVNRTANMTFGGTDCSLLFAWAEKNKIDVDVFVSVTDNETWAGNIHPSQALNRYRKSRGVPGAKNVVVGMTATEFTIADPKDPGTLDVVGLDTATPQMICDFAGNRF